MRRTAPRRIARLAFATVSLVLIAAAFLRGDHLLGFVNGLLYAGVAAGLLWFLAQSLILTEKPSLVRAAVIVALSIPLGFVLADPASINPDVQHFIDKQATDRAARAELAAVFASDPAYRSLSISTTHLKVVNVTIRGSLDDRPDLDRLRERLASECPVTRRCPLHWDVMLRGRGQRLQGLDRELFKTDR